jgi:hypothetical protein
VEPTPELLAVPASTDLFSAADPRAAGKDTFDPLQPIDVRARTPTAKRLVVAGATGLLLAHVFDMPFLPDCAPPVGTLFVLGLVTIQALRRHSILQRLLGPPVAALFFAFGPRSSSRRSRRTSARSFFLVLIGAAVAIYEWAMDGL